MFVGVLLVVGGTMQAVIWAQEGSGGASRLWSYDSNFTSAAAGDTVLGNGTDTTGNGTDSPGNATTAETVELHEVPTNPSALPSRTVLGVAIAMMVLGWAAILTAPLFLSYEEPTDRHRHALSAKLQRIER